jgi:hypothetical protein
MLTLAEIARDWNCTSQYVSLCVKKGCPKDTFENAREWRDAHTNKASKKGPPVQSFQFAEDPPQRKQRMEGAWEPKGNSLDEALESSVRACLEAWRLLDEAFLEGKPTKISVWLNLHNKAVEARVKVERMIREELERQKVLIPMTEAKTAVRRVVEIVVSRLSAMPQNIAPRANPHNPEHAMEILQDECAGIIADAQKASIV